MAARNRVRRYIAGQASQRAVYQAPATDLIAAEEKAIKADPARDPRWGRWASTEEGTHDQIS